MLERLGLLVILPLLCFLVPRPHCTMLLAVMVQSWCTVDKVYAAEVVSDLHLNRPCLPYAAQSRVMVCCTAAISTIHICRPHCPCNQHQILISSLDLVSFMTLLGWTSSLLPRVET